MQNSDWFLEQVNTIRNLCDIVIVLHNIGKYELLPTAIELMFGEIQQVTDEQAVEKEAL